MYLSSKRSARLHILYEKITSAVLALIWATQLLSCGTTLSSARLGVQSFVDGFIQGEIQKEHLLQETCRRFRYDDDVSGSLGQAIKVAQAHNFAVLCRALSCSSVIQGGSQSGSAGCVCDSSHLKISFPDNYHNDPSVQHIIDVLGATLNIADKRDVKKILGTNDATSNNDKIKSLIARMTLARAGLFVNMRLADEAQRLADHVAASFSIFEGFARPVLERVAAEIVAAGMDLTLNNIEKMYQVPRADFSKDACVLYDRAIPRSKVSRYVLERSILRYAIGDREYPSGTPKDCAELNKAKVRSGDSSHADVCSAIIGKISVPENKSAHSTRNDAGHRPNDLTFVSGDPLSKVRSRSELEKWLRPEVPSSDAGSTRIEEQANALRTSAKLCVQTNAVDYCTLDRILPVASYIHALTLDGQEPARQAKSFAEIDFQSAESRLSALEAELMILRRNVEAMQRDVRGATQDLQIIKEESERSWQIIDHLNKQNDELVTKVAVFSQLAYNNKCRDRYEKTIQARNNLAQELGFSKRCPTDPQSVMPASYTDNAGLLSIEFPEFCIADSPVKLTVRWNFEDCNSIPACSANTKGNGSANTTEPLCDFFERLAKVVTIPLPSAADRKPFVVIGHASTKPEGEKCFDEASQAASKLGVPVGNPDRLHIGLSLLRAENTAKLLMGQIDPSLDVQAHCKLEGAGSSGVTERCERKMTLAERNECYARFQRVELQLNLQQYEFTMKDCLNQR